MISIGLPNKVILAAVPVMGFHFDKFEILIGMDIITGGDFSISNHAGETCLSFRFPSQGITDFTQMATPVSTYDFAKVGRNDDCPCGSGKKYKNCHEGAKPLV